VKIISDMIYLMSSRVFASMYKFHGIFPFILPCGHDGLYQTTMHYIVLPVLWMMLYFHIIGAKTIENNYQHLCTISHSTVTLIRTQKVCYPRLPYCEYAVLQLLDLQLVERLEAADISYFKSYCHYDLSTFTLYKPSYTNLVQFT